MLLEPHEVMNDLSLRDHKSERLIQPSTSHPARSQGSREYLPHGIHFQFQSGLVFNPSSEYQGLEDSKYLLFSEYRTFYSHLVSQMKGTKPLTFMSGIPECCEKCYGRNTHFNFHA